MICIVICASSWKSPLTPCSQFTPFPLIFNHFVSRSLLSSLSQVLESSKRWWKCKNDYDQIGFVPHNILEPINHAEVDTYNVVMRNQSMVKESCSHTCNQQHITHSHAQSQTNSYHIFIESSYLSTESNVFLCCTQLLRRKSSPPWSTPPKYATNWRRRRER